MGYFLALFCLAIFPSTEPSVSARLSSPKSAAGRLAQTRRTKRIATMYAAVSIILAVVAWRIHPLGIWLLWPIFSLSCLSAAYAGVGPRVFNKSGGRVPITTQVFLAPYLLVAYLTRWPYRRTSRPWDEITPGLLIGRTLNDREAQQLLEEHGSLAILDLTAECTPASRLIDQRYFNLPLLDSTVPNPAQLESALRFIGEQQARGPVLVHCALGFSRSALVVAAFLLDTGRADGVESAIAQVKAERPGARFNTDALALLQKVKEEAVVS
jgi:protein-tyrosine phosphatase